MNSTKISLTISHTIESFVISASINNSTSFKQLYEIRLLPLILIAVVAFIVLFVVPIILTLCIRNRGPARKPLPYHSDEYADSSSRSKGNNKRGSFRTVGSFDIIKPKSSKLQKAPNPFPNDSISKISQSSGSFSSKVESSSHSPPKTKSTGPSYQKKPKASGNVRLVKKKR